MRTRRIGGALLLVWLTGSCGEPGPATQLFEALSLPDGAVVLHKPDAFEGGEFLVGVPEPLKSESDVEFPAGFESDLHNHRTREEKCDDSVLPDKWLASDSCESMIITAQYGAERQSEYSCYAQVDQWTDTVERRGKTLQIVNVGVSCSKTKSLKR